MLIEFQISILRLQISDRLPESESEHQRLIQLLELGEQRLQSMAQLEHSQRRRKAFVDRLCRIPDK